MKPSHQDETLMQLHQLEVGTPACRVEAVCPRRRACAGGRLHGREYFRARANGFSPRLLGFVGKTWGRGQLVRATPSIGGTSYASPLSINEKSGFV
ncbi:MAG: hypothetical protein ABSB84_13920 [Verrucomicrobiota bacterium]